MSDSFLCDSGDGRSCSPDTAESGDTSAKTFSEIEHLFLSCEQLIARQRNDTSSSPLFEAVVAGEKVESLSTGYFVREDLLMLKWTPLTASAADDSNVVTQIVIQCQYRIEILNLAHDNPLADHLGIRKTYHHIL